MLAFLKLKDKILVNLKIYYCVFKERIVKNVCLRALCVYARALCVCVCVCVCVCLCVCVYVCVCVFVYVCA